MPQYYIKGRLAEDGQTMDFPVLRDTVLHPMFRARYHVHTKHPRDYTVSNNLVYLALPTGTILELGRRDVPVPFKDREGKVVDVRRFQIISPTTIRTGGLTLAKIHAGTPYQLRADFGTPYHSFEMLETPAKYKDPNEEAFDFVMLPEAEKSKLEKPNAISEWVMLERGSRVIKLPGAVLFPDYCAYRLPGWLAKEFNGSPEFGFSHAEFKEPRKGEVLHSHHEIMEPYMCLDGVEPLFVAMDGGSTKLVAQDGKNTEYSGEVLELKAGDVVIPLPHVAHKIVYDGAKFPFTHYCPNYAAIGLDKISADDRQVLEK